MSSPSWQFPSPNRFTVGAIGEPGARVFYVQVFAEGTEVDVKCEKQQAVALAEHLVKLLDDLPADAAAAETPPVEALPPEELSWVVGSISIGVDRAKDQIVVLFEEIVLDDEDDLDAGVEVTPGRLRVHLTPAQVHGFANQMSSLAERSRPVCRLCNQPMDPSGHACPRLN